MCGAVCPQHTAHQTPLAHHKVHFHSQDTVASITIEPPLVHTTWCKPWNPVSMPIVKKQAGHAGGTHAL